MTEEVLSPYLTTVQWYVFLLFCELTALPSLYKRTLIEQVIKLFSSKTTKTGPTIVSIKDSTNVMIANYNLFNIGKVTN